MSTEDRARRARRRLAAYVDRQAGQAMAPMPAPSPSGFPEVTIVVPIHDAAEQLTACLRSLARNTSCPAALLLIDDASTDLRIDAILARASGLGEVTTLRNPHNLGFTATVNRALRACGGDVVLLNSDTVVGPRWLEGLVRAAYAHPSIGTVTPLSDNAGAFSAPRADAANPLPPGLDVDSAARVVAVAGSRDRLLTPTGNGFCMYVKRALLDAVGEFDERSFPRGYGEENDLCMRAARAGWIHVVDGRSFVHHERSASFGPARNALAAAGRRRLGELHPDYGARVRAFAADPAMARARAAVGQALARAGRDRTVRPRLLFVVHEGGGGAVATNADLMGALSDDFECFCFSSDRERLRLRRVDGPASTPLDEVTLERPLLLGDISRPDYRRAFAAALDRCGPELVHVRHLYKHTFDAPRMATARAIPVVMSVHDHYSICPTIHLLDERGRYCGGTCTDGHGECPTVHAGRLPPLKHAFVHQWREEVEAAIAGVDAFVTTSAALRDVHRRHLGPMARRPFELIEHGRDLEQQRGVAIPPRPGGPVRIVVPGHLDRHKGAELIAAMRACDREGRLELHLLGEVPERYRGLGVVHGRYERDELAARSRSIGPAFSAVLSATAESYSHAITESWAAGIPVLVTDLGAQAERVRARGGGFVVAHDDPPAALAAVLRAADDPVAYARQAELARVDGLPGVTDMAARYRELYAAVLDGRRTFDGRALAGADPPDREPQDPAPSGPCHG